MSAAVAAEPPFRRVCIAGVGLIGGSIARRARRTWPAVALTGVDRAEMLDSPDAVELLNAHRDRLTFPVEHFMWHASHALIAGATGDHSAAIEHAGQALEFASLKKSGFSRHPTIGLVAAEHEEVLRRLRVHTDD